MFNINKVILGGVACNTPTLRQNGSGTSVTNFTLKTIETWKDRETKEIKRYSKYHKIVAWGKQAERIVKFVKKDVIVLVDGCINYHRQSKDDHDKNIAEIKVSNVEYKGTLRRKNQNDNKQSSVPFEGKSKDVKLPITAKVKDEPIVLMENNENVAS